MPKKPTTQNGELTPAQAEAARYNEAAAQRVLTHSPRRSANDRTPLLSFEVSSQRYDKLELLAEDESEAIRAFRQCHGVKAASITCRVQLQGPDPRPQPNGLGSRVEG